MRFDPIVDLADGLLVKGCAVGVRAVIVGVRLQKGVLHDKVGRVAEPHRVGSGDLTAHVAAVEIFVQCADGQTEHGFHLRKRLALCAVGGHGEGDHCGIGREDAVIRPVCTALQKPDGKIRRSLGKRGVGCALFGVLCLHARHQIDGLHIGHALFGVSRLHGCHRIGDLPVGDLRPAAA